MFLKNIKYIFASTLRRKILDKLLSDNVGYFKSDSVVLDIGGRDRGKFIKPKNNVKKWIFADIDPSYNPDVVLDVSDMKPIKSNSIDVILATELFEHVAEPQKGIKECFRVLKKGGIFIISAPFLYRIHADPDDFQRWTDKKWIYELETIGFKLEKIEVMGRFFSVMSDNFRFFIQSLPRLIKYILYPLVLMSDFISLLDRTKLILNSKILDSFHGGYFIVATKS
ncbi:MAG: methyltransferase domain-containing protein [Candidatus Paceibacterota bacterium]|jgi:SAM-dependent methyltransferase